MGFEDCVFGCIESQHRMVRDAFHCCCCFAGPVKRQPLGCGIHGNKSAGALHFTTLTSRLDQICAEHYSGMPYSTQRSVLLLTV